MALSPEDKGDVKRHLGKALANKVKKVTNDSRMQKALPGSGRTQEIADQVRAKHFKMSGQTKNLPKAEFNRTSPQMKEARKGYNDARAADGLSRKRGAFGIK